jgi:peptidoglycan hydrolase-like protein with peptidoglycan-binding domain
MKNVPVLSLRLSAIGAAAALSLGGLAVAGPASIATPASAAETFATGPCPYHSNAGHPTLKYGASNNSDAVKHAQCLLNNVGYDLKVDGVYGANTVNAVERWQAKHKALSQDGVVGAKTWESLHAGVNS